MDLSQVRLPDNAVYHLCGPVPFMQEIRSALIKLGIRPRDIQYEVFGPDLWQADYEKARGPARAVCWTARRPTGMVRHSTRASAGSVSTPSATPAR